jgi:hypothetical protein
MTTKKEVLDWLKANQGVGYDFDGFYGVQCMDLINEVTTKFFGVNITAGKMYPPDVWAGSLPAGWTKESESQAGDIFITKACSYSPVGHIGFVADDNSHIYDQNGTGQNDPITYRNGLDGIYLGFIRPPYAKDDTGQSVDSQTISNFGGFKMACLVNMQYTASDKFIKGDWFYWSPEAGFKYLEDGDDIKYLNVIAKHNMGKELCVINSTQTAPVHIRLAQINGNNDR